MSKFEQGPTKKKQAGFISDASMASPKGKVTALVSVAKQKPVKPTLRMFRNPLPILIFCAISIFSFYLIDEINSSSDTSSLAIAVHEEPYHVPVDDYSSAFTQVPISGWEFSAWTTGEDFLVTDSRGFDDAWGIVDIWGLNASPVASQCSVDVNYTSEDGTCFEQGFVEYSLKFNTVGFVGEESYAMAPIWSVFDWNIGNESTCGIGANGACEYVDGTASARQGGLLVDGQLIHNDYSAISRYRYEDIGLAADHFLVIADDGNPARSKWLSQTSLGISEVSFIREESVKGSRGNMKPENSSIHGDYRATDYMGYLTNISYILVLLVALSLVVLIVRRSSVIYGSRYSSII